VLADALYRSDPDQGGGPLLEAMPASPELFLRLRSVGRELALPVPAVSSLLDLAVDGSGEALARLFALAPLARGEQHDEQLEALLCDGLVEVGEASSEEMLTALRAAPPQQALAAIELVGVGLTQAGTDVTRYPLARAIRLVAEQAPQMEAWLAILEHREVTSVPAVAAAPVEPVQAATQAVRAAALPPPPLPVAAVIPPQPAQSEPPAPAPAVTPPPAPSDAPPAGRVGPSLNAPHVPDASKNASQPCAAQSPCAPAEAARPGGG
jgi:D-alanyl-D-alanine carboxypeptidase/D-alanyl-D-alanine-endopeptidase (penicillin-binding protein 4)